MSSQQSIWGFISDLVCLALSYSICVKNCGEVVRCEMIGNFVLCRHLRYVLFFLDFPFFYLVCFWFHVFLNREVNLNALCWEEWRESHPEQQQQTLSVSVSLCRNTKTPINQCRDVVINQCCCFRGEMTSLFQKFSLGLQSLLTTWFLWNCF